jgi:hypothetical protein
MRISRHLSAKTKLRGFAAHLDRLGIQRLRPADLFDAWMFAEADATLAIAAWRAAPREEKGDAYAAYVAALDRETQAADILALRLGFA